MSFAPPGPAPGPFDDLLIPFDPTRGLDHWWEHLDLHVAADPKVAAARMLLERRFGALSEGDLADLAGLLWASVRRSLQRGTRPSRLRAWLGDGDQVLRTVEQALDLVLAPTALEDVAQQVRTIAASDSPGAAELASAKAEVAGVVAADFGPATVLLFAAGVGLAFMADQAEAAIHGHPGMVYEGPHVW